MAKKGQITSCSQIPGRWCIDDSFCRCDGCCPDGVNLMGNCSRCGRRYITNAEVGTNIADSGLYLGGKINGY